MALAIFVALLMTSRDRLLFEVARTRDQRLTSFLRESAQAAYREQGVAGLNQFTARVERELQLEIHLFEIAGSAQAGADTAPLNVTDLATGQPFTLPQPIPAYGAPSVTNVSGNEAAIISRVSPTQVFLGRNPRVIIRLPGLFQRNLLRFLMAFAAAGLLCLLLARSLTKPIVELQQAARKLAEGETNYRVTVNRKDELGALGQDFNRMAARIQSLVAARDELLRRVSHELRSPLARLSVALELLRREVVTASPYPVSASLPSDPAGDPANDLKAAEAIARCERETARLNELIGQLLTYSRITQSPLLDLKPFDLERLTLDVAADINYEAESLNCGVEVTESFACRITGDRELLRSALENVLRNAIHHAPPETTVTVRMRHQANHLVGIVISDAGPGIPALELEHIFDPFYRVKTSSSDDTVESDQNRNHSDGAGLGLSIARRAVELHRGGISAENESHGGLSVTLTLPY
ncbi:MAG: ATP-binding protein [Blastocatellia bacterium]